MERIGIYGGTFNPLHTGHLHAAKQAIESLGLDRLILVPDRIAPHKQIPAGSPSPEQRLEMLRIAVRKEPKMEVSDIELKREGKSYTYLTVEQLHRECPDAKLYLLMGTDMFVTFDSWVEPERITDKAVLAVMFRGDKGEAEAVEAHKEKMESRGAEVVLVENDAIAISSTQMRRLLAFRCAAPFLPEGVEAYIREHGLYDSTAEWKNLPMEELEAVVVRLLNPNRVAHVLGCRDTAAEMAKRWGVSEVDAARAGLLHDITKAIDGPLQLTLCGEYGTILSEFGQRHPKTLHALTGSLVAGRIFGENEAVVSAICHHTTGKADMSTLEKIVYVADYMEPCRNFDGVEELRRLAYSDLDGALRMGLEMTIENLISRKLEISPESREALDWLNEHEK